MKLKKRMLSTGLAAALALSMGVPALAAVEDTGFSDVDAGAWYADAVEYVRANGLMNGTTSTAFAPDAAMTRSMLAATLYRAAGSPAVTGTDAFTDTADGAWYADAVLWASQQGVINGYGDGLFGTDDAVSREQIAAILWRQAGSPQADDAQAFADQQQVSAFAQDAVAWARANSVINGKENNTFDPQAGATRAEVAAMLQRFLTLDSAETPDNEADGVVRTTTGLVQGTDEDGIYRYLGIPYAQAAERFVPAEDVEPWDGVFVADTYGAMSPQGSISGVGGSGDQSGTDNNCQNLNIWTPGINDGEKRPVMVWLHGGGFSTGSANEAQYDGENLSRSGDVVVVSVNHRLNVFGQSGGGAKVLALMTSPYAEGLFDKGIVQSGATETMGVRFNTQESSTALTGNILDILGITAENIEDIQTVPAAELQAAAQQALQQTGEELQIPAALGGGYSMDWEPVVDGDFLPTDPVSGDSFAEAGRDIPLLIGSNLNEWSGFFASEPIEQTGALTEALRAAYPNKPDLTADQVDSTTIRLPLLKIMSHKADQGGAPVYAYMFTYGNSYHTAEISYVFNNVDGSAEQQALAAQISAAWVNFARTDTPGADGLPAWEPYTREGGATMILDTEPALVYHHDQALMQLLAPDYEY